MYIVKTSPHSKDFGYPSLSSSAQFCISPRCHPERSSPIFSTAPHSGASGCVVEGPWQHVKPYLARWNPSQFQHRVLSVIPPALSLPNGSTVDYWLSGWAHSSSLFVGAGLALPSCLCKAPAQTNPKPILSPNPLLRPNPRTGDFNRHERLFPLFTPRVGLLSKLRWSYLVE